MGKNDRRDTQKDHKETLKERNETSTERHRTMTKDKVTKRNRSTGTERWKELCPISS